MTGAICRVCNRPLKNPRHAQAGIGPVCAGKLGLTFAPRPRKARVERPKKVRNLQPVVTPCLPFEEEALP